MITRLFFAKGMKLVPTSSSKFIWEQTRSVYGMGNSSNEAGQTTAKLVRSRHICLGLIVLLLSVPLLTACSDGTTGSNSGLASTSSKTSSSFGGITQLKMIDANNGWATTSKAVLTTSDGGQHWSDVTPADWEATTQQSDPNDPNNKGISAAFFLDGQDAWIVSSNANAVESQVAATAMASGTPDVQAQMQVYVRATIDGGKTWMDAQQIQVDNLSLVYPPYFINQHEGWLVLSTTSSDGKSRNVLVYHSTDGGIIWQLEGSTVKGLADNDSIAGFTMAADCTTQCSASNLTGVQGCTTTGTTNTSGWLVHSNKGGLLLHQTIDSGRIWRSMADLPPGGAPGQSDDSLIVASPPTIFADGTGVLPIQMQSNPNSNDPSNFYLHLYKLSIKNGGGASGADLSTTSPFASQLVAAYHTLSAPDLNHIFVLGYDLNNGTSGGTNLYAWSGGKWQTLSSQVSSSSSSSGSSLFKEGGLTNLDFISDTEGWATSNSALYHITLNGNNATWTQVFPPADASGNVTLSRNPGQVLSAPANPGACGSANNNKIAQAGPTPTSGERTITLVNNTSQTIWAAAAGNAGFPSPANGGWVMAPGSTFTVKVASNWAGRFWGRTSCSFDSSGNGKCETGDCGRGLYCNGATAAPPQTLAEILFGGWGGNDFYDVSHVDGFNVPMTITPVGGAAPDPNNKYRCGVAGCGVDLNPGCPTALQVKNASGQIIGCNSACAVFGTNQYCCLGTYVGAACNPNTWPVNYAAYFKSHCPDAYSYAYDDATSTFTDTNVNYRITFGPAS